MPVYMIRAGDDGPDKIGVARDQRKRLRGLQTAHAESLHLIRILDGGPAGRLFEVRPIPEAVPP